MVKINRSVRLLSLLVFMLFGMSLSVCAAEAAAAVSTEGKGYAECALGDFAADALREVTGADVALFAAGDLGQELPAGEITAERLRSSFPNNTAFSVVSMTGAELKTLLEEGFSSLVAREDESIDHDASASDDFFCVSGLTLKYTAGALPGDRIYTLSVQAEAVYTVAVAARYVDGEASWMLEDVMDAYLSGRDTVEYPATGRMECLDAGENKIVGSWLDVRILYLAAAVLLAFSLTRARHGGGRGEKPTLDTDDFQGRS